MNATTYQVADNTPVGELYTKLAQYLDRFEQHSHLAHKRSCAMVESAIDNMRRYCRGELDTDLGAKKWFKGLSKLAEEVGDMDEIQSAYVFALTEVAHAASHLGHVNLALSRGARLPVDADYLRLQSAYVNLGFAGADDFLNLIDDIKKGA